MRTEKLRDRWLAVLAIMISVPVAAVCTFHSLRWVGEPFPGFFVLENAVVPTVLPYHWSGHRAGVPVHAFVVAVEGRPLQRAEDVYAYAQTVPVGSQVRYTLRKGSTVIERAVPTMEFAYRDYWSTVGLFVFNGAVCIAAGIIVVLLQPASLEARVFLVVGLLWGLFGLTAGDLYGPYWFTRLHLFCQSAMPAAFIHLAVVFPVARVFVRRRPGLLLLPYAAAGLLAAVAIAGFFSSPPDMRGTHVGYAYAASSIVVFIVAALLGFWENPTALVRLRIRVVLLGTLLGGALPIFVFVNNAFSGGDFPMNYMGLTPPLFFACVGYAVAKHDLFEIDALVKRTFIYLVLTFIISGVYALALVLSQHLETLVVPRTVLFNVLFVLLVVFLFDPLRMGVQNVIDRAFYRGRLDYSRTLAEISRDLTSVLDMDEVGDRVTRTLVESMQVESATVALWGNGAPARWAYPEREDAHCLGANGPLQHYLRAQQREIFSPVLEERVADAEEQRGLSDAMGELGAVLIVPLVLQGDTVGALALGKKTSGRAFTSDDLRLLTTLANETAIALQNARSYRRLTDLMQQLEAKVDERTAALRASNAELGAAYERLKSTQAQLVHAEKMASLGRLVAGVAHEINNPVSFVAGTVAPLRQRLENVATVASPEMREAVQEATELVDIMARGAERTVAIVKDLRSFSRVGEEHRKAVDVHEGLEVSLGLLQPRWGDRIVIHRDYGELPPVECDPGQVNQVFMNLLSNACDAIAGTGNIWVRTRAGADFAQISIRDDGCGMTPQVMSHVFDPFFSTKDVGGGTGLGLAISHGIVNAHGGCIEVESTAGIGATFHVVLPIKAAAPAPPKTGLSQLS